MNLLFMMTDHQRADTIGMTKAGIPVTPALTKLAAESAYFERGYTTSPICTPARTALATGLYPTRNGVVFNDWGGKRAGDHVTIHETLTEAGYKVAHVGVDHIKVSPSLRDRGAVAHWVTPTDHLDYLTTVGVDHSLPTGHPYSRNVRDYYDEQFVTQGYSSTVCGEWPGAAEHFLDSWLGREAEDFIRQEHDRPWALFVYLWAPHPPLRVPEPYRSMFPPAELTLPADVGQVPTSEPATRTQSVSRQLTEGMTMDGWHDVWAAHLGLCRLADDALGRVLATLDETGQADETLTLFTVDHGDHLGQRAMYQKFECYEPALRVPIMMRGPGVTKGLHTTPISHLDIVPTVLDWLELSPPTELDGRSLADSLRSGDAPDEEPVFAQYSGNSGVGLIRRTVISGTLKYTWDTTDEVELYDLADDPLELHNLADDPAHAKTRRRLHRLVADYARKQGDWLSP